MGLKEQLHKDMQTAAKERNSLALSALRMAVAAVQNREIEAVTRKEMSQGGALPEEAILKVIAAMVKQRRDKIETRIRTGKTLKMTPMEREKLRQQKLQERFKFEAERMAGYELIFPCGDRSRTTNYETLLKKSHEIWDDFNLGKTKNKTRMMNEAIKAKVTHMMKMTSGI